jgi:hypothetical protein
MLALACPRAKRRVLHRLAVSLLGRHAVLTAVKNGERGDFRRLGLLSVGRNDVIK